MPMTLRSLRVVALALPLLSACAHDSAASSDAKDVTECPYRDANDGTQSYDLLCREPVANQVSVKHILIGWSELATPDHPRLVSRTYAEAQELARALLEKLRAGEAIEPLMQQYSEDPGSAGSGAAYDVDPAAAMVMPFKALSLRLNVGESGVVKSTFGLHVIQRVR